MYNIATLDFQPVIMVSVDSIYCCLDRFLISQVFLHALQKLCVHDNTW